MNTKNLADLREHYKTLNIDSNATDEEITASYKRLAFRYHPDKNPGRVKWATDAMTQLNVAYTAIMSQRFRDEPRARETGARDRMKTPKKPRNREPVRMPQTDPDMLTKKFIHHRELAKDALYRYFQYSLYSIPIREKVSNQAIFNKVVFSLRKSYHAIRRLTDETEDPEFTEHFDVFAAMLFNFYRASECLNIIDSYSEQYEVEAFRSYRQGDEHLHHAHKEIFYDRHNRGYFKSSEAYSHILYAEKIFYATMKIFSSSSWAVETQIKLEYARSLKKYVELFFTDETLGSS
jgi:curved DNA-binding protein CbpA